MQGKHHYHSQTNLFKSELKSILSDKIDLYHLTEKINWEAIHTFYGPNYAVYCRKNYYQQQVSTICGKNTQIQNSPNTANCGYLQSVAPHLPSLKKRTGLVLIFLPFINL